MNIITAVYYDKKVRIFDIKTAVMIAKLHHDVAVNTVATDK